MPAKFVKKIFKAAQAENDTLDTTTLNDEKNSTTLFQRDAVDDFSHHYEEDSNDSDIPPQQKSVNHQNQKQQPSFQQQQDSLPIPSTASSLLASQTNKFFGDDDDEGAKSLNVVKLTELRKQIADHNQQNVSLSPQQKANQHEKSLSQLYLEHQQALLMKRNQNHDSHFFQEQQQQENDEEERGRFLEIESYQSSTQQQHQDPTQHQYQQHLQPLLHQQPKKQSFVLGEPPKFVPPHPLIMNLKQTLATARSSSSSSSSFTVLETQINNKNDEKIEQDAKKENDANKTANVDNEDDEEVELWRTLHGVSIDPRPRDLASPVLRFDDISISSHSCSSSSSPLMNDDDDDEIMLKMFQDKVLHQVFRKSLPSTGVLPPLLQHTAAEICRGNSLSFVTSANGSGRNLMTFLTVALSVLRSCAAQKKLRQDEESTNKINHNIVSLIVCPSREIEMDEYESFKNLMDLLDEENDDFNFKNKIKLCRGFPQKSGDSSSQTEDAQQQKMTVCVINAHKLLCPLETFLMMTNKNQTNRNAKNHNGVDNNDTVDDTIREYESLSSMLQSFSIRSVIFTAAEKFAFTPFLTADANHHLLMRIPGLVEPTIIPPQHLVSSSSALASSSKLQSLEGLRLVSYLNERAQQQQQQQQQQHQHFQDNKSKIQWIFSGSEHTRTSLFVDSFEKALSFSSSVSTSPQQQPQKNIITRFSFHHPSSSLTLPFEHLNRWSRVVHVTEFVPATSIYSPNPALTPEKRETALLLQIIQRTPPPIAIMCWSQKTVAKVKADIEKVFPSSSSSKSSSTTKFITDDPFDFATERIMPWILVTSDSRVGAGFSTNVLPKFNHIINFEIPLFGATRDGDMFREMMSMRAQLLGDPMLFASERRLPLVTTILSALRYSIANVLCFTEFLKSMRLPVPPMLVMVVSRQKKNNQQFQSQHQQQQNARSNGATHSTSGNGNQQDEEDDDMMKAFDML